MSQMHTGFQFEQLEKDSRLIIRDDHYDLPVLADLLETAARRKAKVILLDTGRFAPEEFEQLADFPFNLYTSDRARKDFQQLNQIFLRLEPAGCEFYYFLHGELENSQELGAGAEIFSSIPEVTAARTSFSRPPTPSMVSATSFAVGQRSVPLKRRCSRK